MGIIIEIPSALKHYVENKDQVEVSGNSIEDVFKNLCSDYPQLKLNIFDQNGEIRRYINIYLNAKCHHQIYILRWNHQEVLGRRPLPQIKR